ncbi:MAG: hypothetical protein K0S02_1604 [Achromobacter mucicolens]|jgi:hypothetical protein|uniref:hypothetical protein n=1 Tax=Achromobacter mucicolens TaxID=1389922 RepID=UPI00242C8D40|nr:hypothetical protein [Achromobacter mucicolens]MDF2861332.1 hypothetical protein [Achromobacter mucicolens]
MKKYSRALIVVLVTSLFWAAGEWTSFAWGAGVVKGLAGIFAIVSALLLFFFRLMNTTTGVGTLSGREMERYTTKRKDIRRRFWIVLGVSASCSGALWILGQYAENHPVLPLGAGLVGFLFAVNVANVLSVAKWIDEISAFADTLRSREQRVKENEALMKRLAEAKKRSSPSSVQ